MTQKHNSTTENTELFETQTQ